MHRLMNEDGEIQAGKKLGAMVCGNIRKKGAEWRTLDVFRWQELNIDLTGCDEEKEALRRAGAEMATDTLPSGKELFPRHAPDAFLDSPIGILHYVAAFDALTFDSSKPCDFPKVPAGGGECHVIAFDASRDRSAPDELPGNGQRAGNLIACSVQAQLQLSRTPIGLINAGAGVSPASNRDLVSISKTAQKGDRQH